MIYFDAKSDLKFMHDFINNVQKLWDYEAEVKKYFKPDIALSGKEYFEAVAREACKNPKCMTVRGQIAKSLPRAIEIAYKNGVTIDLKSLPRPDIGSAILPINLFYAILHDTSWDHVDQLWIRDKLNETIGQCERRLKKEFRQVINPAYWLYSLFRFILRLPFILLSATGFDISKIEDHLLGRVFKVIEIVVLIFILLKLGFNKSQIIDWIKVLIGK